MQYFQVVVTTIDYCFHGSDDFLRIIKLKYCRFRNKYKKMFNFNDMRTFSFILYCVKSCLKVNFIIRVQYN